MSQNSRNLGFSNYLCFLIEGSGSGYVHLTSGSGSGRLKTYGSASEFIFPMFKGKKKIYGTFDTATISEESHSSNTNVGM
jgi:hypothetical protein